MRAFAKRKYHRGKRVEGAWVFGGIERTAAGRVFLEIVPDRSAATLLAIIRKYVRSGSIIYSDMWKAYDGIERALGLQHYTVNHKRHFKDPRTGVHTNAIEGTWCGVKRAIPIRNRNHDTIEEHLFEYIWRKQKHRLWEAFLECLASIKYEYDDE